MDIMFVSSGLLSNIPSGCDEVNVMYVRKPALKLTADSDRQT